MAYQVLARKSRPQDFSSVVGQAPVVTALRNALSEGRVAQAYLFAGIRGVGKTSVARVFAKALNCERGPGTDPCNECTTCVEITRGSDLDVIEVDAATYSKVEQVRELTESLRYGPARDRYKVVVIDEIHRLSRQAFDALLKIVEEPPEGVVFIFATTEVDAVPATILSRCQEFHFRRVAFGELSEHLRRLCDSEGIEASEPALRLIARAAEGSVRDAVALLDQLATYGSGTLRDEDAARLIGGLDGAFYLNLLTAILDGDGASVCSAVARLEDEGWDPRSAYTQLLSYLRDTLHLALGANADEVDLPGDQAEALAGIASDAGSENLLRVLHLLLASEMTVRRSESGALAAEVAWLRAAELPKLTAVEALLSGGAAPAPAPAKKPADKRAAKRTVKKPAKKPAGATSSRSAPARESEPPESAAPPELQRSEPRRSEPRRPESQSPEPPPEQPAPEPPGAEPARASEPEPEPGPTRAAAEPQRAPEEPAEPEPPVAKSARSNGGGARPVERLLEEVGLRKQFLAAHLAEAEELDWREDGLRIVVPATDTWLSESLARETNRKALEEALAAAGHPSSRWTLVRSKSDATEPNPSEASAPSSVLDDPSVQTVLDIFGGTVEGPDTAGDGEEEDTP